MTELLKKYLLVKYTEDDQIDTAFGNQGDIEEYGRDEGNALYRAQQKHGGKYVVIGEIVA